MAINPTHDSGKLTALEIKPLSPHIGAVIGGVDLRAPLSGTLRDALYQALLDHKVIFFRDQDLTADQHIAFARCFGELEIHPFTPNSEDHPEIIQLTHNREHKGRENFWHSDVTWRLEPSLGSVLRAIEVPAVGGDTLFANMELAYEALPEELRERLDGMTATHDFAHFRRVLQKQGRGDEIAAMEAKYPNPQHPVVRSHPDTGRKSLYVNVAFTQYIDGLERAESDALLARLYAQAAVPEYQCRFRWEPNSIAFWDNRACQHYATSDYWPAVRRMERVTIVGDKPR